MNDLSGLQWQDSNGSSANTRQHSTGRTLNPTPPISRGSTPASGQLTAAISADKSRPPAKASSPAPDSFASLLSSKTPKPSNTLSLQERQKQLQEEKARQQEEQRRKYEAQYGLGRSDVWDSLGSGKNTPQSQPAQNRAEEDDILSAFNSSAPVDSSSYFPPPDVTTSSSRSKVGSHNNQKKPIDNAALASNSFTTDDDDDPFGLGAMASRPTAGPSAITNAHTDVNADDDVLGLLGKPVSEVQLDRRKNQSPKPAPEPPSDDNIKSSDPRDQAVADLVDMGFPADASSIALAETATGLDVQAAVGILLNRAHEEARQKSRGASPHAPGPGQTSDSAVPPWMRSEGSRSNSRSSSAQRRQDNRSPAGDKDVAQYASEFGTTLFKSANTLWKTGQKRVQKVVADFQQDQDPNQPKWMREAGAQPEAESRSTRVKERSHQPPVGDGRSAKTAAEVTDEALLLESDQARPYKLARATPSASRTPFDSPRTTSPAQGLPERPGFSQRPLQQRQQMSSERDPRVNLSKQAIEEQSSQAYVSPARRRKAKPVEDLSQIRAGSYQPQGSQRSSPAQDPPRSAPLSSKNPYLQPSPSEPPKKPSSPLPATRPKPTPRAIPPVSPTTLATSTVHRQTGSQAFKRGDYAAAHTAYTAALAPLPVTHPLTIPLRCNRALTALKIGDPKGALADADAALATIGPARGEGETVDTASADGGGAAKPMREFWAKAVMRRAEALEHVEKWAEAAAAWRTAVEAGVGGAVSLQGRSRCESAVAAAEGQQQQPEKPAQRVPAQAQRKSAAPVAAGRKAGAAAVTRAGREAEAEAVRKLRAQNQALERADEEKFALTDAVDAKLAAWKGGKADNLRALLGSLDGVLWPEAGWKKVGMSDLVMPNKVKVVYMKAIAKVHPDKIPQDATTEQRMISGAVFSTLNEAWDKFKKDNGL
ncbi:MAG: hypothetical protein M1822_004183 [Bathelium mastoideum]|nr:MAG: hypothetical protein M1822_004183 [Bathelium mastoideum]